MSHFVSLHGHSDFSLRDGLSTPHRLAKRLTDIGQTAVALTDHGTCAGIAVFDKELKKHNLKLIAGLEAYVASKGINDTSERDTSHLTLIAMNMEGYHNLCKLHSISWQRPAYYFNPRIDLDVLADHSDGLICLSGCLGGYLLRPLHADDEKTALSRADALDDIFGERFFIELQNHHLDEDAISLHWLRALAKRLRRPAVATTDFHYVEKEDWKPHDIVIACGMNTKINDPNRKVVYKPGEFYVKDYDEMAALGFSKAELAQAHKIAEMCEPLKLESKTFHIPVVDKGGIKKLREIAWQGILKRYHGINAEIRERFEYELKAIEKGGFTQYLLLLHDMYVFMKEKGIPYGPGRGSAAASIICYALGITGLCPLEYGLLFERFINPERVSAPDIDCDISAERRSEVIQYLKERWGEDHVAQIVTFGTFGARAAVRDVARVMDMGPPKSDIGDRLAKLIPQNGSLTTDRESRAYIDDALTNVKEFRALYDGENSARTVVDTARTIEGIVRSASLHAAGIVIADRPLSDYAPLLTAKEESKGAERPVAVAYAMNELEALGLIKFDLLGLKTVDVTDACVRWMKAEGVVDDRFDLDEIPLDDPETYSLLSKGLTAGVFQLESSGMSGWLRKLKPDRIADLIAMVALYRPGPMAFIETYVRRKQGEIPIEYPDERLEEALAETYGVAVFQEQLMKIGQVVAGWSLARADQLRKVVGKKIIDKIAEERKQFADDAAKNGYKREWADDLFEKFIEPAARYSFNKGHASVYGYLAYQTAYLKANYPVYYFGSLMASIAGDQEKTAEYIADARAMGVSILPPDVNESELNFTALPKKQAVRYGLMALKNVGEKAVKLIIKERKRNGSFTDLFDFVARTRDRLVTSRTIESLVLAGALDSLPGTRVAKYNSVVRASEREDMLAEDRDRMAAGRPPVKRKKPIPEAVLVADTTGTLTERDLLSKERELLGTYLSGHPFDRVRELARSVSSTGDLRGLRDLGPGGSATVCGIVTAVKPILTKRKQRMYTFVIEDNLVSQECIAFPKTAHKFDPTKWLDDPIVIFGRLEDGDEEDVARKFIVDKWYELNEAPEVRKYVDRDHDEEEYWAHMQAQYERDAEHIEQDIEIEGIDGIPGQHNRYYLRLDNYERMIAAAQGPCTFILPNGETYVIQ